MNSDRRAGIYVALIFVSGLLLGGTVMNLAEHFWLHPRTDAEIDLRQHARVAQRMAERLKLTPQQAAQVDRALDDVVRNYTALELQMAPAFQQIRDQGRDQVRAILTDQQRRAFDQLVQQVDLEYPGAVQPTAVPDPCNVLAGPVSGGH